MTGWRRHIELRPKRASGDEALNRGRRVNRIRVRPDFIFRRERLAVFVDGCFWHGCPLHATKPKGNADFWDPKLLANKKRDAAQSRALTANGWYVMRIWEHELRDTEALVKRLKQTLGCATHEEAAARDKASLKD
jgi:DNA mismatch endonuclease (patch repair protein)